MNGVLAALVLTAAPLSGPDGAAHLRTLQEAFLEAWVAADETRRAAALRELERLVPPGAPAGAPASARALGRAWRTLVRRGDEPDAGGQALEILAEAVELRAVPGLFAPSAQGEPMTVHVSIPESLRPAGRVELELRWLGPDGDGDEGLPARSSEAWPDAFGPEGFELFVRTPQDARPGTWRLELQISDGQHSASAPAVEVECLVAPDDEPGAEARALRRELDAWRASGRPVTQGLSCGDLIERRGGRHLPFELAGESAWAWRAQGEVRTVVIVLSPARDPLQTPLCGVRGEGWRAAAAAEGWLVLPWRVQRRGGELLAVLPQTLRAIAPDLEQVPRVLVARADSALAVAFPAPEQPPFDAWVLSWWADIDPRLPWPATPTRVLRLRASTEGQLSSSPTAVHRVVRGTGHVLLDDLLAPALAIELAAGIERSETQTR